MIGVFYFRWLIAGKYTVMLQAIHRDAVAYDVISGLNLGSYDRVLTTIKNCCLYFIGVKNCQKRMLRTLKQNTLEYVR